MEIKKAGKQQQSAVKKKKREAASALTDFIVYLTSWEEMI